MTYRLEYTSRTGGRMTAEIGDLWVATHRLRACKCEAVLTDGDGRVIGRVVRNDGSVADRRVRWIVREAVTMKYRIHVRTYMTRCRPYVWQTAGMYEIDRALTLAQEIRNDRRGSSGLVVGVDVWLVPV